MGFEPILDRPNCGNSTIDSGFVAAEKGADETEATGGSYVNILICTYTIFQTVTFYLN